MDTYECRYCHYEYCETDGEPILGIEAGTKWADIDPNWHCPHCGAGKTKFRLVEEAA
jgi:rubredoxin